MQVQRQALGELALQRNEGVLHHIAPANAGQGFQRVSLGEDHHEGHFEQRLG